MLFFDFEVFKNDWLVVCIDPIQEKEFVVVNDKYELQRVYNMYKNDIWVGFNCRGYDQFILKAILLGFDPKDVNDFIITKGRKGWEYSNEFHKVPLVFFDCMVGFNGLKTLEAFMGESIHETSVPFDIDRKLTAADIAETIKYCRWDVENTIKVFLERQEEFDSYVALVKMYGLPLSYLGKTKAQLSAAILGASKQDHNDEFAISFPDTLKLEKYTNVTDFFKNDWDYDITLETLIAGVPHVYGTGGIHGAIPNYIGEGEFLHIDVNSYYPSLMIEYPNECMSRNIPNPKKFTEIRDKRLEFKKAKDPMQQPLKIVLNSTYGAMKDKYNPLYDPRQANNVCVFGQLLLTDLIEKLEGHCQIIQSNTDGLIVKLRGNREEVVAICKEWERRTRMGLGYDDIVKVIQRDVNNYIAVFANGSVESKGSAVKMLSNLDYDLPIINEALKLNLLYGIPIETTINECDELIKFQKVVKLSSKYKWVEHEQREGNVKQTNKSYRVFASSEPSDGRILKCDGVRNPAKFANTPDHCKIVNDNVKDVNCPLWLDKSWYIHECKKRRAAFA